jgi:hypothetical protein
MFSFAGAILSSAPVNLYSEKALSSTRRCSISQPACRKSQNPRAKPQDVKIAHAFGSGELWLFKLQYYSRQEDAAVSSSMYLERAQFEPQQPSHRQGHGAPSKEDTATGAKTHLSVSQTKLSRASFSLEDRCLRMIRFQSPVVRPRKRRLNGFPRGTPRQYLFARPSDQARSPVDRKTHRC